MASLCVAYFFWLFGGFLGLHHFYLGRYKQAFLWWCFPGGYFGAGWIRDLWRIPEYVADCNNEPSHVRSIKEKMKEQEIPAWKMARWSGMLVVGNMFGLLPGMAIPNKEDLGADLSFLKPLLNPLGNAIGIWLVGNVGRWKGSILHPLIGCYLTLPLYFFGINPGSISTLVGAYCFRRRWRGIERECTPSWRRVLTLVVCGLLYTGLWSSYLYYNAEVVHNGDKIKLRDAVGNFLKSPLAKEFGRSLGEHWNHMKEHGFWSTYTRFIDSLDPFGEKNAFKVLGLQPGATQEEIRSKYRELSKQWHPDKVKENKEEAQERFVEIQRAYETLSKIKSRRARANRKVVREDSTVNQENEQEKMRREEEEEQEELREEWNDAFSEEIDPKLEL